MHGSTLPSHPAFCWVGGGCPPFLLLCPCACAWGVVGGGGGMLSGSGAACPLCPASASFFLLCCCWCFLVVVWGVVGVWVGWL